MVRDRAEAADLLGEWQASGARMSDWCRARGLNWYSLNAYRGRGVVPVDPEPQFVELTLATPPVMTAPGRYHVRLDGIEVEVDDNFREDTLVRLLGVLAAC
jgi:hypothetical protein